MVDPTHNTRLALVERDMDEMKRAVMSISESNREISNTLKEFSVIAHEQATTSRGLERAFAEIVKINDRLNTSLPRLIETRKWILSGLGIVLGVVLIAILVMAGIKAAT